MAETGFEPMSIKLQKPSWSLSSLYVEGHRGILEQERESSGTLVSWEVPQNLQRELPKGGRLPPVLSSKCVSPPEVLHTQGTGQPPSHEELCIGFNMQ